MHKLPANKEDALALIVTISENMYARTRFDDLEEMDAILENRHQLIEQFFCDFKKTITDTDLETFRRIQSSDEIFRRNLEENKLSISEKIAGEKKSKQRMRLYTKISKQY